MKVTGIWKEYAARLSSDLADNTRPAENLEYVRKKNLELLREMNTAVGMMQKQSEGRVRTLLIVQLVGVLVGMACMAGATMMIHGILLRLGRIGRFARTLRKGGFYREGRSRRKR